MKQNFTVRQSALDGVEVFLSLAQHRSFRRAAAQPGGTPSAVSQTVRLPEARIGAALFIRITRSVGLTEAGERFLSHAKPAFEELVAASEIARGLGQRPTRLLRLSVPRAVMPILLEPLIASFCQAYPEVEVEIAASKELIDLAAEGFDAGIRQGQFVDADMVAVPLIPSSKNYTDFVLESAERNTSGPVPPEATFANIRGRGPSATSPCLWALQALPKFVDKSALRRIRAATPRVDPP